MRNARIIFSRELAAYFDSAIAYIFLIVFLLLNGGWFMMSFFLSGAADMRGFFGNLPLFNLFFLPAVTMRLWAEDRRIGTMELLMTLPMKSWEIVLGKYLASLAFYGIALVCTMTIPVMLTMVGDPDVGAIVAGYVGSFLVGALYLAIGIFVSGLFKDQIAAFVVAMVGCFFFFSIGWEVTAGLIDAWIGGLGSLLKDYVGLSTHYDGIQRGVIDLRNVFYFVSMSAVFLVLNTLSLEGRKF
jgi:ABC-type transport system involved in multi-copper enzyme maturation permease subunit